MYVDWMLLLHGDVRKQITVKHSQSDTSEWKYKETVPLKAEWLSFTNMFDHQKKPRPLSGQSFKLKLIKTY